MQYMHKEEKFLKTGCQAPQTPTGCEVAKALSLNENSFTMRDKKLLRAHLNPPGLPSARAQDISVLYKTPI